MPEFKLRESRSEAILKYFPETGPNWLAEYPRLLPRCVDRWNLTLLEAVTICLPINMIYFAEDNTGRS
ncbi:MAG: hypothetical protein QF715_14420 [Pseudomonadales bacterium]|nr:hypothetical protein [Gammaproteobacteria bacterium]MDP6025998.1 hypothetical protein [Pseudomonadales bacterium]MDP7315970.1 hypothetical protein [Pseudomonadales bacterium]